MLGVRNSFEGSLGYGALSEFVKLAAEGRFTVPVVRTYPLAEWRAALDLSLTGHAHGKLMLQTLWRRRLLNPVSQACPSRLAGLGGSIRGQLVGQARRLVEPCLSLGWQSGNRDRGPLLQHAAEAARFEVRSCVRCYWRQVA